MAIVSHVTRELPYNIPFSAKIEVITRSFESWTQLADSCAETVVKACRSQAVLLARKVFRGFTYGDLDRAVKYVRWLSCSPFWIDLSICRASAESEIQDLSKKVKQTLEWLITMEYSPYTQNLHYFSAYRDKYLSRFKSKRQVCFLYANAC